MIIYVTEQDIDAAKKYAELSKQYTSNRHDFHQGGLENKRIKMMLGKIGEKAIANLFRSQNVFFIEDNTNFDQSDNYDFLVYINGIELKVDVKTRTKSFHTRTVEMVEQIVKNPKDIFISVYLDENTIFLEKKVKIIGYIFKKNLLEINRIENLGYLNNYVCFDNELSCISELLENLDKI